MAVDQLVLNQRRFVSATAADYASTLPPKGTRILMLVGSVVAGFILTLGPYTLPLLLFALFLPLFNKYLQTRDESIIFLMLGITSVAELINRMLGAPLPYEFGKYFTVLLLTIYAIKGQKNLWLFGMFYFALMLPSLLISEYDNGTEARKLISFSLSGPLLIAVSITVLYGKRLKYETFKHYVFALVLATVAVIVFMLVRLPNLSELSFNRDSNFDVTAGFGPNQVSTLLGFSAALAFWFAARGETLITKGLDIAIILLFVLYSLFTFSRGGFLVSATIILLILLHFLFVTKTSPTTKLVYILLIVVVPVLLYPLIDNFTGNTLSVRYEETFEEVDSRESTSGRVDILLSDLELFKQNVVLGVGPGLSGTNRVGLKGVSAHTEYTRLLSEHGSMGLLALVILSGVILSSFFRRGQTSYQRLLKMALFGLGMATLFHSAMRLSSPALYLGLGLVDFIIPRKDGK